MRLALHCGRAPSLMANHIEKGNKCRDLPVQYTIGVTHLAWTGQ